MTQQIEVVGRRGLGRRRQIREEWSRGGLVHIDHRCKHLEAYVCEVSRSKFYKALCPPGRRSRFSDDYWDWMEDRRLNLRFAIEDDRSSKE